MKKSPAETVLIVEGDVAVRHALAEYLRECGFRVLEAVNGEEARMALQNSELQVTIVIADGQTSGSGFRLARWIRDNKPEIDMVLAGSIESSVEKAGDLCLEGPALAKPYDHRFVLDRIKQMIAARSRHGG